MSVRTIVTTDGSEASRKVEEFVLRLNRALSLHVTLVHVIDLRNLEYKSISDLEIEMIRKGARRAAEGMIEKERLFLEQSGVKAEVRLLEGEARRGDLRRGRTGERIAGRHRAAGPMVTCKTGSLAPYRTMSCNIAQNLCWSSRDGGLSLWGMMRPPAQGPDGGR